MVALDPLRGIESAVPGCRRCPRLVAHLRTIRAHHADYWARPVPGHGDRRAAIVVVGLAPGLHGAGRTGRPFQGDASGEWLYASLAQLGLWNGRRLRGVYIVNAVKCVPPQNRPTTPEVVRCNAWLARELEALDRLRLVLALGSVAHRAVLRAWNVRPLSRHAFGHDVLLRLPERAPLLTSYHPSRQNTNTGRLTRDMWSRIWQRAAQLAELGATGRARRSGRAPGSRPA